MTTYLHHTIGPSLTWLSVILLCLLAVAGGAQTDLFISEYVEGSGNNKCIEIFNPTASTIGLSAYTLNFYNNGNPSPSFSFPLSGSITPGAVHLVCHPMQMLSVTPDDIFFGIASYNGDDAITLEKAGVKVDIFGNIGCPTPTIWTGGGLSSQNMTLVRKGCINQGITNDPGGDCPFPTLASEWIGYSQDDASHLGSHGHLSGPLTPLTTAPSDCGSADGSITVMANGSGLEYSISGTGGPFYSNPLFQNLSAGTYEVVARVTNDPSCLLMAQAIIDDQTPPTITSINKTDPTDCGMDDGSISILASGTSLEYSIDNGVSFQTDPLFLNLAPGTYQIAVRLSGTINCIDEDVVVLLSPTNPNISSITPVNTTDCGIQDGQITINASPSGLQYSIDNGANWSPNASFSNLGPGDYDIVVRKASATSCRISSTTTIQEPPTPTLVLESLTDAHCKGAASGSILLTTSGGSGSYQYIWDGPTPIGNVPDADHLLAGLYSVTVSDDAAPGCQDLLKDLLVSEPLSGPPIPDLDDLPQLCQLDAPYPLPRLQDGFDGTWSGPGIIDGSTFDPSALDGQIELTFVPDFDQCALSNSTTILVDVPQIPFLDLFSPVCSSGQLDLPATQDGITGSWSGEGVINNQFTPQGSSGTVTLNFNPDQGQCAEPSQTSIEVIQAVTPAIQFISNLCENENPVTLLTNQDGVDGNWSGPGIDNNVFNPLGLGGLVTLHFAVSPDQCAADVFKQIEIFDLITPELDPFPGICEDAAPLQLPVEQDQILGNWSGPGVIDNHFDPMGITASVQLTFTPLSNQCGSPAQQNITIGTLPMITLDSKDPLCYGNNNGAIRTTISGGTAPFKIDWDIDGVDDFDDQENLSDLAAGTYRIEVKDQLGCTGQELAKLDEPVSLKLSKVVSHESSAGANDGSATVVVSGGTRPYQYLWNNGNTLSKIENLGPAIYSVTVTDDHECADSIEMIINSGNCAITVDVQLQHPSCFRHADGQAEVIVSNSLAPHSFQWSHNTMLDQPTATDLQAGDYMVTIADAADCQHIVFFEITDPDSLVTSLSITPESYPGAGDATISASTTGGTIPYIYRWSNDSSEDMLTDLIPGQYAVTTSDSNGCLALADGQIEGINCDLEIELIPRSISCYESLDGHIKVRHSGGDAPFVYQWSHDSTLVDSLATSLGVGNYAITVHDFNGCIATAMTDISAPQPISVEIEKIAPSTSEHMDGQLVASVSGGVQPYQWAWSTGDTTSTISNLETGSYTLTVTDDHDCTKASSLTLEVLDCDLVAELELDSVSCAGKSDGRATLNITNGAAPYDFQWSHDTSLHLFSAEKLKAGDYTVTVTAADGCVLTLPFTIKEPEALRIAFRAENETFIGAKDGYIAVTPIGGSPPYFYNWNTGETADSLGNLKPGTYIITLTDAHGCQDVRSTMINPANCTLLSNVSVRPVVCFGESTGSARLDITTLAFPVRIRWSIDTTLRGNVLENLSAGLYSVTITDEDQCRHTWPFEVREPDPLELEFEITHQSDPGIADGTVQTTVYGGNPGYTFQWSHGATSDHLQNLNPGTYHLTVVDQKGCTLVDSLEILPSDVCQLEIEAEIKSSGCNAPTGSIQIQPDHLRGNATYTWSIPDGGATNQIDQLRPGAYWVEVRDDYCMVRDTFTIDLNSIKAVSYSLKQSLCIEGATSLEIGAVSGGTAPYAFYIDAQRVDPDLPLSMAGGLHQLRIEDSEGCSFGEDFNVTAGDFIRVINDTTIKRGEVIKLNATIEGNSSGLKYYWRSRGGILCEQCLEYEITPEESGLYIFELVDQDGCRFERSARITVTQQNLIYIPNAFTPNGDDINDDFIIYDGLNLVEEIVSLEIYDRRGILIYRGKNLETNMEIPFLTDILKEAIAPQLYMYLAHIRYQQGYEQRIKGDFMLIH